MADEDLTSSPDETPIESRPVRLTNRQKDIVRTLACVMWTDGHASPAERAIIQGLIDELAPGREERAELEVWLDRDCSALEDVELERLTADEKQILLTHAVLLSLADDVQLPSEKAILTKIIDRLALPPELVQQIIEDAREDRAVSLPGSVLQSLPPPGEPAEAD